MPNIKEKLEKQIKEQGTISSADVADVVTDVNKKSPEEKLKEADKIIVSDTVKNNTVLQAATIGDAQKELDNDMTEAVDSLDTNMRIVVGDGPKEEITILPEHKLAFIDTMITNKRFTITFSLFNGKVTGEIQSRTQNESFAIFEQLNRELNDDLTSQLAYSIRLRNMLLTAQITRLNGDHFTGLKAPLFRMIDGDKKTPPAWLDQVNYWIDKDEGFVNILFKELRKFEYIYLTMMENASDQNFWKTDLSI